MISSIDRSQYYIKSINFNSTVSGSKDSHQDIPQQIILDSNTNIEIELVSSSGTMSTIINNLDNSYNNVYTYSNSILTLDLKIIAGVASQQFFTSAIIKTNIDLNNFIQTIENNNLIWYHKFNISDPRTVDTSDNLHGRPYVVDNVNNLDVDFY